MAVEILEEILLDQLFVEQAIKYSLDRNPDLRNIDMERISRLAKRAASEMAFFEKIARTKTLNIPEAPKEAKRIKAIWDMSSTRFMMTLFFN